MLRQFAIAAFMTVALVASPALAEEKAETETIKLDGIPCVFCKKQVSESHIADYKGAKIYLGCAGCAIGFPKRIKTSEVLAAKANWQLVVTEQARQKGCPMGGGEIDKELTIKISTGGQATAKVGFCCEGCKKKAEALKDDEQLLALFSEKVFKKAYEVAKQESATE